MHKENYDYLIEVLKNELVPASGCTEPIAVAYGAALARYELGRRPEKLIVKCSGNVLKNVKGVTVPNTENLKGVKAAAITGVIGGDHLRRLEVIENVTCEEKKEVNNLVNTDYCDVILLDSIENLYIVVRGEIENDYTEVTIAGTHTNIIKVEKNGETIFNNNCDGDIFITQSYDIKKLSIKNILDFAENVDLNFVKDYLDSQIKCNMAIADEGLNINVNYGIGIGYTLEEGATDVFGKAKCYAAAASESRMGGCNLPVVTNSGSGNQGITVSVPIVVYCREKKICESKMYKALLISNLISVRIKAGIGRLSAFCGAVSAACGTAVAITYLEGGNRNNIEWTIKNMLGNVSGIVCDGAKISCALKIYSALDAGFLAHKLAMKGQVLEQDTGIIKCCIEETIDCVGRLGKEGMRETDRVILNMML